jgi:membrane protein
MPEAAEPLAAPAEAAWAARLKQVFLASINAWITHRASSKGAALAFYTLFSMTPILLLALAIAGYVFGAAPAHSEIAAQLQARLGPKTTEALLALLETAADPAAGLLASLLATFLFLLAATSVFAELKGSLDELWGIDPMRHSAFIEYLRTRLLSFTLVLVLALILLVSIIVSATLVVVEGYTHRAWGSSAVLLASSVTSLVSFAVTAGMCALIFKALPDTLISWRDAATGAVFTAGLFSLGKYLIGLYLGNSSVATSFGAGGSLVALLLWVYYSAQIFFLGAEFTRQYALEFGSLKTQGPS